MIEDNQEYLSKIRSFSETINSVDVTDKTLKILSEGCNNLQEVNFWNTDFSENGIINFAQSCKTLTKLSVQATDSFTDRTLQAVVRTSNLVSLTLTRTPITDAGMQAAVPYLSQLHEFSYEPRIGEVQLPALLEIFQKCTLLKKVSLTCVEISSNDITTLLSLRGNTLEVINLWYIELGGNAVLNAIAERCTVLTQITFMRCRQYSDKDISEFMAARPTLLLKTINKL